MNDLLIYRNKEGHVEVDAIYKDETLWLSQKAMVQVFAVGVPAISKHLKNIFSENELEEKVVVSKMENTTRHGAIKNKTQKSEIALYNLDAIIAVGYRVNSKKATDFRIWATAIVKEYMIKGFSLNDKRFIEGNKYDAKYFDELLERLKGYNKINLYLALKRFLELNCKEVMVDCTVKNIGSNKTIENFNCELKRTEVDPWDNELTNVYWINVEKSLDEFEEKYKINQERYSNER